VQVIPLWIPSASELFVERILAWVIITNNNNSSLVQSNLLEKSVLCYHCNRYSARRDIYSFLISSQYPEGCARRATTLIFTPLNSKDGLLSGRNFSKVTSSMQRESGLMLVPSNWCSLIEIMSHHRLRLSSRRNIHGIRRSAIYFLHSFGILIFISRFRVVVITHWSTESPNGREIKGSEKCSAQNTRRPFAFDSPPATGLMIMLRYTANNKRQKFLLLLLTVSYSLRPVG